MSIHGLMIPELPVTVNIQEGVQRALRECKNPKVLKMINKQFRVLSINYAGEGYYNHKGVFFEDIFYAMNTRELFKYMVEYEELSPCQVNNAGTAPTFKHCFN